ncbi:uncharacterized protein SOCE26_006420 [Sorangium cellulosum]|uniref:Uncharacterized protein n=1 Tax=Sorangium cellulosum TaxID=56 RepID=A0A2L0EIY8_SORCE|nr:uncharacterized protein SOCE26_006420 [Sorangium cellulosum]
MAMSFKVGNWQTSTARRRRRGDLSACGACAPEPFLQGRTRTDVPVRRGLAGGPASAAQSVKLKLFSSVAAEGDSSSAMAYERWPTRALRRTRTGAVAPFSLSSRTTTR